MKWTFVSMAGLLFCNYAAAQARPPGPRILGIFGVHVESTNIAATRPFYQQVVRPDSACLWCEQPPTSPLNIPLSSGQVLTLTAPPKEVPQSLLYEIVFATDNLKAMRAYLLANKVLIEKPQKKGSEQFAVTDPEGHTVRFFELPKTAEALPKPSNVRIIHAGFVVHDRAAEDKFYKDILGFHVYWHGGMKEGEDNWVDMQVPDGTDWIEYMLNVPANADHHTLGVMNHIALGVPDIKAAEAQLRKNGWTGTEQPKIGRDGKWQLNLYDPDDTRVEFMEFTPTQKPCCSEYTGPHPGPKQ